MKYLEVIKKRLEANNVKLTGCTNEQIKEIENRLTSKLPLCYTEFLEIMGNYTDLETSLYKTYNYSYVGFGGESVFYDNLIGIKKGFEELLEENGIMESPLKENDFIFFDHQGYIYAWFNLDEGDNPPVYGYSDGYKGGDFPKLTDSLLEFYEKYLDANQSPFVALR